MNILTMAKNIFSDLFINVQNLVNISMFERLIIFLSALILFSLWTYKGDKHILDYSKLAHAIQSHEATCLLSLSTLKLFHLTHIHSLCAVFFIHLSIFHISFGASQVRNQTYLTWCHHWAGVLFL